MPRRLPFCAALAALAALAGPVALGGPALADGNRTPGGDAAAPTQQTRLQKTQTARRPPVVSRRASRARATNQAPLSVTIDTLTPSSIPERGVIRVSGVVTNNDTQTWSTINLRPFISATPLTSAEQLATAAAEPPDAVVGDRINDERHKDFIEELAPGQSLPYRITVPRRLLNVTTPGVYWFGVHALGASTEGRDETADGRARTFLPLVPASRPGQEPTAVAIPLRHQLVYTEDGAIDDLPAWIQTLSPGGRLRSLVDFGASSGDRVVTWLVDPALIDAVRRIADGDPPRSIAANLQAAQVDSAGEDQGDDETSAGAGGTPTDGDSPAGASSAADSSSATDGPTEPAATGAEPAAANPLDLRELDPVVRAAATAARAWLARLGAAMRPEDQVLTLPYGDVDAAGAAVHDPGLLEKAQARSGTSLAGFDVTTTPALSSPSGFLNRAGIRVADPSSTILVTDQMLGSPAPALAETEGHEVLVTSSEAAQGGPGPDDRTALIAMRQRLLAEAAVRFLRDEHAPLTMVLPHDWVPRGDGGTFFGGLDAPWLDLTSVAGVARSTDPTPVDGAALRYPKSQRRAELDKPNFDAADALIRSGVALQNMLTLNNIVAGSVADQALGSASYSSRTRPIANRAATDRSRLWIEDRLGSVHVTAPRAVTLSSSSGRFQAVVVNGLDQPVTVALDAKSDGPLTVQGPRRVEVPANGRQAVLLTAHTNESGIHQVRLILTDKRGTPLGAATQLTIRSAQVSNVIWLFLGLGLALFFGALGVRLFRRVRNARRAPADTGDPGDPGDPGETGETGAPGAGGDGDLGEQNDAKQPAGAGAR